MSCTKVAAFRYNNGFRCTIRLMLFFDSFGCLCLWLQCGQTHHLLDLPCPFFVVSKGRTTIRVRAAVARKRYCCLNHFLCSLKRSVCCVLLCFVRIYAVLLMGRGREEGSSASRCCEDNEHWSKLSYYTSKGSVATTDARMRKGVCGSFDARCF